MTSGGPSSNPKQKRSPRAKGAELGSRGSAPVCVREGDVV